MAITKNTLTLLLLINLLLAAPYLAHGGDKLAEQPMIHIALTPDFPPAKYLDGSDHFFGIGLYFLALLKDRLPAHFEIVNLKSRNEVMDQAKNRDKVHQHSTSSREIPPWLLITIPVLALCTTLITIIMWNRTLRIQVEAKTKALQHQLEERHKAEQEKEELLQKIHRAKKMEALGLLAGGVAHDLNNVLSGIVGYPDLLLMQLPDDSPMRKTVLAIKDSGKRAAEQVSDLLTIARGSASEKSAANLSTLVQEHLNSPEHTLLRKEHPQITVSFVPAKEELLLTCSTSHLNKTILNLVINGMEAMGDSGKLTITTRPESLNAPFQGNYQEIPPGDYVVLAVSDSGSGIKAEDLDNIFAPFYSKKKMGRSGTGLGLAIVWNTIEDHQGAVNIISSAKGTTFDLYFPQGTDSVAASDNEDPDVNLTGHNESILIVDDEKQMRDIARQMLANLGYQVTTAASGDEAVAYMEKNSADLLLLDMIMEPGINGRQTYEKILAIHPGQKAIIVSGFSESSDVLRAKAMGAGQFIRKPYTMKGLGLAIKKELA